MLNLSRGFLTLSAVALVGAAVALAPSATAGAAANCQFLLGFKTLHDLIPEITGECVSDETHNPENGDGLQLTTKGMMVWRKIDNNTAFTDGTRSWINGPQGLQNRLNSERLPWEVAAAQAAAAQPAPAPLTLPAGDPPPPQPAAAQPTQPAGGVIRTVPERALLILDDIGNFANLDYRRTGSDSLGQWAEVRFFREEQLIDEGLGPTKIVNRIYVAKDVAAAQAIYNDELAKQGGFPESTDRLAEIFVNEGKKAIAKVGDEADSRGACSVSCVPGKSNHRLHERTIVRSQNVVIVLYYWGRDEFGTPQQINQWLARNMERLG